MSDLCRCADEVRCAMQAEIERLTAKAASDQKFGEILAKQVERLTAALEEAQEHWYNEGKRVGKRAALKGEVK